MFTCLGYNVNYNKVNYLYVHMCSKSFIYQLSHSPLSYTLLFVKRQSEEVRKVGLNVIQDTP